MLEASEALAPAGTPEQDLELAIKRPHMGPLLRHIRWLQAQDFAKRQLAQTSLLGLGCPTLSPTTQDFHTPFPLAQRVQGV